MDRPIVHHHSPYEVTPIASPRKGARIVAVYVLSSSLVLFNTVSIENPKLGNELASKSQSAYQPNLNQTSATEEPNDEAN